MGGSYGYELWVPIGLTVAIWMGAIFGIAAFVSDTWADLFGLFSLVALPFVYRSIASLADEGRDRNAERADSVSDSASQ